MVDRSVAEPAAWSPSGELLAFVTDDEFSVTRIDGTPRQLAEGSASGRGVTGIAWSPGVCASATATANG